MKFNCDVCNFDTDRKDVLNRHCKSTKHKINMGIIQEIKEIQSFKCDECDYETNRAYNLKIHLEHMHINKLIKCDFCNKRIRGEEKYNLHRKKENHKINVIEKCVKLNAKVKKSVNSHEKDKIQEKRQIIQKEIDFIEENHSLTQDDLNRIKKANENYEIQVIERQKMIQFQEEQEQKNKKEIQDQLSKLKNINNNIQERLNHEVFESMLDAVNLAEVQEENQIKINILEKRFYN